jgi:hypothetical protein
MKDFSRAEFLVSIFFVLKSMGHLDWSWCLVFLPIFILFTGGWLLQFKRFQFLRGFFNFFG